MSDTPPLDTTSPSHSIPPSPNPLPGGERASSGASEIALSPPGRGLGEGGIRREEGTAHESKPATGLLQEELAEALKALGLPAYRTTQVWKAMYHQGAQDFATVSTLSKVLREQLAAHFTLARPKADRHLQSIDGTEKWLLSFADGNKAESVFIPEVVTDEDRGALCVSSQVGCTLTCSFCHTGTQKLVRNLEAHEIVGQFLLARDSLGEWAKSPDHRRLTNIVLMGMGEPLFNYENVAKAMKIIMDPDGIAWSKRRITLSTSGVVPMMERVGSELGVNLAISLHAVRDDLRNELVPLNKKYPIAQLMEACRNYPGLSNARRITFEYVMLKDVNDTEADAKELIRMLHGIPAKVNLIPFNPWPGAPYECSSNNRIHAFADILYEAHLSAPIRTPRGRDIFAACGQLRSESERVRKSAQAAPPAEA